jgi:glycosyltransferase involved in cell wall biosynthesis
MNHLRIFVDFPWDASACMGTGAYSETMVRSLAQAAPEAVITLVVPPGAPRRIRLPNVAYASLPETEGLSEGTRQIALPAYLAAVKADCLFAPATLVPAVKVCPTVVTVHDLAFETHEKYYAPALTEYLKHWFPSALKSADRIVAISEPVKQDLLFRKRIPPGKVAVIEQPIRQTFLERLLEIGVEAELRALGVSSPFFFHVSNLSAHKNMEFGVRAFAAYLRRCPGASQDLLFAGGGYAPSAPPDLIALARILGIGDRVRYVGKVSDSALKALYQRCDAFLFPSLVEGWGLPVVEARTLGAKVIASPNVPSALSEERLPLEPDAWASELGNPEPREASAPGTTLGDAGNRLLGVIREAIEAYRRTTTPSFGIGQQGDEAASRGTIAIRGDWHSPSGFGQAARGVFQALECSGVRPIAVAVPKDSIQDKRLWRENLSLGTVEAALWIHHTPPDHFDLTLPGRHVGFVFWETDRLPKEIAGVEWRKALSRLDEIWAPSTFVAEVLRTSGVTAPIVQVPPPVDERVFSPGPRRPPPVDVPPGFDPSWTVFLYVGTWDHRKRPDLLVRNFSRAFTADDQALLLIKSYVTGDPSRDRTILGDWVVRSREGPGHVRVIPEVLSPGEMADLFRSATAFVTASRGEGYCLPAVQAMSAGKPVVATAWSSFQDFPVLPVDYQLRYVPSQVTLPGYTSDMRWAEIDENDLCEKLRWIHEHRNEARLLGKRGRNWVLQNCAPPVVGKRLQQRIQNLCRMNILPLPLEVV